MPPPSPDPRVRVSRRAVLAGFGAMAGAALAGCTAEEHSVRPKSQPTPAAASVDPDVAVAAEALASQRELLDLLDATSTRHPELADRLAPVIAVHKAHADLLADAVPKGVSLPPSPSAAPSSLATPSTASPSATSTPGGGRVRPPVPRSRSRALARVVAAEQDLATVTKRQAFRAESGAFARLLGSMAAAAAQSAASVAHAAPGAGSTS